ncbi:MAG TPA: DUF2809 domain-containing protein [Fibrobacteria bacterium]|nr:DUF2809 domain-containing protein [Fibrobacteria bacterium]
MPIHARPSHRRHPGLQIALILATIAVGLASRKFPGLLPTFLGQYPGDALWATMVFFLWGLVLPKASIARVAALALATSWIVEFAQFIQAPWLVALRSTTIGHLILGSTFHAPDLVAYTVGVGLGAGLERALRGKIQKETKQP